jgi:signal transduction histidine kinase
MSILVFKQGKNKKLSHTWGWFCLMAALWGVGSYNISRCASYDNAFLWWQISFISIIATPIFYTTFVHILLDLKNRFLFFIIYSFFFIFLFYVFFKKEFFLGDLRFVFNEFYWYRPSKYLNKSIVFYIFYLGFYWLLLSYSFLLLVKEFFRSSGIKSYQLKYFIVGSIVGWLGPHGLFLIALGFNIFPFSNFFIVIYPLIIGYGIIRYRLLDMSIVFTKAGIFVAVYSLILGIPFFIGYKFQLFLTSILHNNWWLGPLVSSTILATIGPFVYLYFDKRTQDRLLKEQRGYQNILRNASSGMIRIKDLGKLLNLIVHVVTKTVRIRNAAIYLLDRENNTYALQAIRGDGITKQVDHVVDAGSPLIWTMTDRRSLVVTEEETMRLNDEQENIGLLKLTEQLLKLKADLVVPSFVDDRLIGFIALGEKVSKKLYSQDDMNVFSVLANQAALAIENAQFYDEIKQTHEQLFQAEKMATIGTMADGLSHQINNRFHALSLISGDALDVLNTSDLSGASAEVKQLVADVKDALQKIQNNVLQGGEVVKGLLKYSRPGDSGFEPVDFKDVLKGSLDMVQYKIKLVEIDFLEKIIPDLPKIHGNLTQLQEVFFNLIDNAYDATRERKLTLNEKDYKGRIEVIARVNEKNSIEINVIDNGMGVKDLDKKKMFTPFFTTKATAKKGTGLGLYVIKKIISAHNGTITVGSVLEKGTHFLIELPLNHEPFNNKTV